MRSVTKPQALRRQTAYVLRQKGLSVTQSCSLTGYHPKSIPRLVRQFKKRKSFERKKGSGRPPALNTTNKRRINALASNHPTWSAAYIRKYLNLRVSARTIANYLKSANFVLRSTIPKPKLNDKQKNDRVTWSQQNHNFDFSQIIFADEASFWSNTYKKKVRVRRGQSSVQNVPSHGFKVHAWGAISLFGKVGLRIFSNNLNSQGYCDILETTLLPGIEESVEEYLGDQWIFAHDNHPVHTSSQVKEWFKQNGLQSFPLPAYSPDLNPIENIWGMMKSQMQGMEIETPGDLKSAIQKTWDSITIESIQNCISSMNNRCKMVIENLGNPIGY